jgi:type II secretory pathway pseudopilin PulG
MTSYRRIQHRPDGFTPSLPFLSRSAGRQGQARVGFTLVELILALAMLITETVTLLSLIFGGMVQNQTNQEYVIARNAAVSKIEEIRGCDFSGAYDKYNNKTFIVSPLLDSVKWNTSPPTFATGKIEINNSSPELYDITITIKWKIKDSATTDEDVSNKFMTRSLLTRGTRY